MVIILKKNIRKIEIKKNKNRTGYKKRGLPNASPDIKFSPSNAIRALPEDHKILQKSKKVECLMIPAYVLNRSINRILTIITENIFSFWYSIKFSFTSRLFKNKYETKTEKKITEMSIKKTDHLGIYLNSLILKISPIYK
nr:MULTISPECIES: hypothetical protein [unclassified Chryseobacterium]